MPILVQEDKTVLFVHVPKCGGSSFLKNMRRRGWEELLSIRGIHIEKLGFLKCTPQHMHVDLLRSILNPKDFDHIVTIVRNPFERMKSEYAWQRKQSITDLDPEEWIDHVIMEFEENQFICDNHIRPQNEFILQQSEVYKLEKDGVMRAIESVSSHYSQRSLISYITEKIPGSKLKKTTKSYNIEKVFERHRSKIQDFYAKDYIELSYSKSREY